MAELPKIVLKHLGKPGATGPHPDPDLLSAFAENVLAQPDRLQVLEHLSQCADCREIVVLALPQPEAHQQTIVRPAAAGWFSWTVLRWGALAACIVVVGAAVTLRYRERQSIQPAAASPGSQIAQLKPEPQAPPTNQTNTSAPPPPAEQSTRAKRLDEFQSRDALLSSNVAMAKKVGSSEPPAEAKLPVSKSIVGGNGASPVLQSSDEAQVVPGRAKDALQTSSAAGVVGGVLAKQMNVPAPPAATVALAPPLRFPPRWTLTANGALQRSLDSGRTWQTIPVPSADQFRALSANGFEIWVGGANGALYHSADAGHSWLQVQPVAQGQVLTADITGVEFTDSLHGTVTTATKETWTTADAGQTWQKK